MRVPLLAAFALLLASTAHAANPVVRFTTPLGAFDVELCNEASALCEAGVPTSVANFLGYVDRGDYQDSVIHRSTLEALAGVTVIQGGGYRREAPDSIGPISTEGQPTVPNEFHQSNVRGTVAYARLSGQPDSATSQWFVNVLDNTDLDTVDGGFTVFGVVTGDGMTVVDALSALHRVNYNTYCLDSIFGPDPETIASAFTSAPVSEAFWTELQASFPASTCDDLPPPIDFANGLIGTEMTRVPEPGGETAGMAAALALGGLARWRTRRGR